MLICSLLAGKKCQTVASCRSMRSKTKWKAKWKANSIRMSYVAACVACCVVRLTRALTHVSAYFLAHMHVVECSTYARTCDIQYVNCRQRDIGRRFTWLAMSVMLSIVSATSRSTNPLFPLLGKILSQQYCDGVLCKVTSDKEHDPALMCSAMFASRYAKVVSSPAYVAVSLQDDW